MRIVTHTCSNTEIVCALGAADQIVGVDDHSDFPVEVIENVAKIGPDQEIDVSKVAGLNPDLVITSLTIPGHEQCVERLQSAGLNTLVIEPNSLADVAQSFRTIGSAIGKESAGEELARSFEAELEQASTADNQKDRPAILLEWWPKPVIVPGGKSWASDLIELAGGSNPLADEPVKSRPVEDEEVLSWNPDAVVISWCGVPLEKYRTRVVSRREAWAKVPALRHEQIFPISEALLGRPGPRLVDGLRQLKDVVKSVCDLPVSTQ